MITSTLSKQTILENIIASYHAESELYSEALAKDDCPASIRERRLGRFLAIGDLLRAIEVYED